MTAAQTDRRGWENILDADEHILWQGRPDPTLRFAFAGLGRTMFGAAFAGFALFWMTMAAQGGGFFWMFGLIHFAAGVGIMGGAALLFPYRARHTWYTLSSKRAFVATDFPVQGRKLRDYPITPDTNLLLDENTVSTLYFGPEPVFRKNQNRARRVGFERIHDGRRVYGMMRDIQRAQRLAAGSPT